MDPEVVKITVNAFLKNLYKTFKGQTPNKLILYLGHDRLLSALLSAFSLPADLPPPYSSFLTLELWESELLDFRD
jgi:hypothetical protein